MPSTKRPPRNSREYAKYCSDLMKELYLKANEESLKERIYEPVDYSEKELAKQFGAKWCIERKSWYFTDRNSWEEFVNY